MKIISTCITCFLLVVFSISGCKPKDADLQSAIQQKQMTGVTVSVEEGVATLNGTVANPEDKQKAEEIAKNEKGVKSVVNNLVLPPPPPPPAPEIADMSTLSSAVKDATKDFPTVSATIADGVITLSGTIKKDKLPKLMMALSALKPKKIENKLQVN